MPKVPNPKPLQRLVEKYHLEVVSSLPAGITPLRFDNPQELENFLSKITRQAQVSTHSIYLDNNKILQSVSAGTGVSYGVVTRNCSVPKGPAQFNTWADIRVGASGSFHWIDSVLNTRTGLTGFTMGVSLSNTYSYAYNQTVSSVSVTGGGIYNFYILIEGGILLFSEPVSCSFTYQVY